MEKYHQLHKQLALCYNRKDYIDYFNLSDEEKERVCKREREELSDYLQTDSVNFDNVLKERIQYWESKNYIFKFFIDRAKVASADDYVYKP